MGEALEAEDLPGVIEAGVVRQDRPRSGRQVLRPPILLGQQQIPVGRAGVKGQGAAICKEQGPSISAGPEQQPSERETVTATCFQSNQLETARWREA